MVSRITSVHNERIKYVRSLARRRVRQQEGRFLVEGTRLVGEVVRTGIQPALLLFTEEWAATPEAAHLLPPLSLAGEGAWLVTDEVLATCADTVTPQGVLAVVPKLTLEPRSGLILILDRLRDPGNLGTILRSAAASSVGQVILTPGTVDPYNPKVVRGAMGAHFWLPLAELAWPDIKGLVSGRKVWLADAAGKVAYHAADWTRPSALIVGSEAAGASEQACDLATCTVTIPIAAQTESLNAAMAATVILFEVNRQQRSQADRKSP
jgi:TrmH family RNA methyltransferase